MDAAGPGAARAGADARNVFRDRRVRATRTCADATHRGRRARGRQPYIQPSTSVAHELASGSRASARWSESIERCDRSRAGSLSSAARTCAAVHDRRGAAARRTHDPVGSQRDRLGLARRESPRALRECAPATSCSCMTARTCTTVRISCCRCCPISCVRWRAGDCGRAFAPRFDVTPSRQSENQRTLPRRAYRLLPRGMAHSRVSSTWALRE